MKKSLLALLSAQPLPNTFSLVTASAITTLLLFFTQHTYFIPILYTCAFLYILTTKKLHYGISLVLSICCSILLLLQIHHQTKAFTDCSAYLNTKFNLIGTIQEIKTSNTAKNISTFIITDVALTEPKSKKTVSLNQTIFLLAHTTNDYNLAEGYRIAVNNIILCQPANDSEYRYYLIKQGACATAFISLQKIKILNQESESLRSKCFRKFSSHINAIIASMFNPMFLGKRDKNMTMLVMQHNSSYLGIAHYMARSGIHLITIFAFFMFILRLPIMKKYFYKYLCTTAICLFYFEISFSGISFIRALLMILIQMFSKLNNFMYSSLHALNLVTLATLLTNPFHILFLDFQLSFGITYIIIWLFRQKYQKTVAFPQANLIAS